MKITIDIPELDSYLNQVSELDSIDADLQALIAGLASGQAQTESSVSKALIALLDKARKADSGNNSGITRLTEQFARGHADDITTRLLHPHRENLQKRLTMLSKQLKASLNSHYSLTAQTARQRLLEAKQPQLVSLIEDRVSDAIEDAISDALETALEVAS